MKTHLSTGTVVKQSDLTDELKSLKGDDSDVVAYASVEVEDRDRDIVRVAGVSLKNHRADSPVKLFASHLRSLPNGESPVIGRVVKFASVTHKGTGKPALAFSARFADTPLGKHYKTHYDGGSMTDFSIGFKVHKSEPLGQDKGLDFQQTELIEVSAVALPANEHASVMRAFEETYPDAKGPTQSMAVKVDLSDLKDILKQLSDQYKSLSLRLDDIESAVEGSKAEAEKQPPVRATTSPAPVTVDPATANAIKALAARL